MRKFLMLGICLLLCTFATAKNPFAIYDSAVPTENREGSPLWRAILNGEPLNLVLELPESEEPNREKWRHAISNSFNSWFKDPAKMIYDSGRAKEFDEVLDILKNGLVFGQNDGFKTTVIVVDKAEMLDRRCAVGAYGCADPEKYTIVVPTESAMIEQRKRYRPDMPMPVYSQVFAHEFGHQLGFTDQYIEDGLLVSMEDIRPHGHSSQRYVTETVMSFSGDHGKLGCDDTDAMINMIDLQLHRRNGALWKSFCPGSPDTFRDGNLVAGYDYRIRKGVNGWMMDLGDGTLRHKSLMDVYNIHVNPQQAANQKGKVLKKDDQGRPLMVKLSKREVVYYDYFQGIIHKAGYAAPKGSVMETLVWVEEIYPSIEEKGSIKHVLYWYERGRPATTTWLTPNQNRIPR